LYSACNSGVRIELGNGRLYQSKFFAAPLEAIKMTFQSNWMAAAVWKPFDTVGCSSAQCQSNDQISQPVGV